MLDSQANRDTGIEEKYAKIIETLKPSVLSAQTQRHLNRLLQQAAEAMREVGIDPEQFCK